MTREEAKEWIISHYGLEDDGTKQSQVMNYVVKLLEQEPCEDAISRQAVLDEMYRRQANGDAITAGFIKNLRPVTPQPKESEQEPVLDKIRTEIERERSFQRVMEEYDIATGLRKALDIIDKYRTEREEI